MDESSKRRVGRPKATPQAGPLVLEGGRARVKVELEIGDRTVEELKEYVRWVERSSAVEGRDALFKTADFALRDLFRRDRLWQERRKRRDNGDHRELPTAPQALTSPAPMPPPLTPPSASPRPVVAVTTNATAGIHR